MIKHWLVIVSLLLLLPAEANSTVVSGKQANQCEPGMVAAILGPLAAECIDEQPDIDTDMLLEIVVSAQARGCWTSQKLCGVAFCQPQNYTLPIRAPPHHV